MVMSLLSIFRSERWSQGRSLSDDVAAIKLDIACGAPQASMLYILNNPSYEPFS